MQGGWDRELVAPVRGKTLGLGRHGPNRPGRGRASQSLRHDESWRSTRASTPQFDEEHQIAAHGLDELLARSDVVSLHLPLNEQHPRAWSTATSWPGCGRARS